MNDHRQQTDPADRSATIAFRTSEKQKHLMQAVAAEQGRLPSDWLRELLDRGLRHELEGSPEIGRDQP